MGLGDAQRLTNVIRQAVDQETRSASKVEFALGVVAVTYGNYADVYVNGDTVTASQNFRVPAHFYVNVGDPVMVAIDYGSNLGKWIVEVIPVDTYSQLAVNPNTGEIYTSDGTTTPVGGSIGGVDYAEDADISTQAFGDTPAAGASVTEVAGANHKHGMPALYGSDPSSTGVAWAGSSALPSRGNHAHAVGGGMPVDQAFGDAAEIGSGAAGATTGHRHGMPANPVIAHEAAGDPHTGYRLESADHTHASAGLQGGQVAHSALSGIGATDHHTNANDPTADQKAALAGTSGTPSGTNKYVTNSDSRLVGGGNPTILVPIFPVISANQNNYAPTGWNAADVMIVDGDGASRTITGLSATGWTEGQALWIGCMTMGGGSLTLAHASGSSSAGNRFSCTGGVNLAIGTNHGGVMVIYLPTRSADNPFLVMTP